MIHSIQTVRFKRTKESEFEEGIMLNDDEAIIDKNLKLVQYEELYDYSFYPYINLHQLQIGK